MKDLLARIGMTLPIVQAPMAGVATPQMAVAVSNAGALGSIAIGTVTAEVAHAMITEIQQATPAPFNVNVFCHRPARADAARERAWLEALRPAFARYGAEPPSAIKEIYTSFLADPAMLDVLLETCPRVVSFHFGLPPQTTIRQLKAAGMILFATATSLDEAEQAVGAGVRCDRRSGVRGRRTSRRVRSLCAGLPTRRACAHPCPDDTDRNSRSSPQVGSWTAPAWRPCWTSAPRRRNWVPRSSLARSSAPDFWHREALSGPGAAATEMTAVISGRPARCIANDFTRLAAGLPIPGRIPRLPDRL